MNRTDLDAELERKVLVTFLVPAVDAVADAGNRWVRQEGPIDTGLLRRLAHREPAVISGNRVIARWVSSRPSDDGRYDVAAFLEWGTRYMRAQRYMAISARHAIRETGLGTFDPAHGPAR